MGTIKRYRSESIRLKNWDYRWGASYFITICTKNREHYFGEIKNGRMHLSHLGVIADIFWNEIPTREKQIKLGEFVVMPNHIHGILIIDNDCRWDGVRDGVRDGVETLHATSLPQPQPTDNKNKNESMSQISPKPQSISTIIRSYKSAVTKHANRLGFENGWQPRFHDHIIRNNESFERISNYIRNNPANWKEDQFH